MPATSGTERAQTVSPHAKPSPLPTAGASPRSATYDAQQTAGRST